MDQVEAGFDEYLKHSNGNPLVYDKVQHRNSHHVGYHRTCSSILRIRTIFDTPSTLNTCISPGPKKTTALFLIFDVGRSGEV